MWAFEIAVGVASIGSFIVSIITILKVNEIEKQINKNNRTKQSITKSEIKNSDVVQVGRDYKGE